MQSWRLGPPRRTSRWFITLGLFAGLAGGLGALEPAAPLALAQSAPAPGMLLYPCKNGATDTYIVPTGITHVFVSAAGGAGAQDAGNSARGGLGARVEGTVAVQPGQELSIIAGCAAQNVAGGVGGDGLDLLSGGRGGRSFAYCDGGGGGGPSGVFVNRQGGGDVFVAGGGGGAGGCAGLSSGHTGGNAGLTTSNPQSTGNGGPGLGSTGGGGGGGGGGGYQGGAGGGGGSRLFQPGSAGDGASSHVPFFATNTKVVTGGGIRGDGFVVLAPLPGVRPAPLVSYFSCQGGTAQPYTVPANVNSVQMLINGAGGGSDPNSGAHGGAGASAQASLNVNAGQTLNVVVGCQGTRSVGGAGYSHGGDPGGVAQANPGDSGGGGGGSSAVLDASKHALVIAGGGGGSGGQGNSGSPGSGGDGSDVGVRGGNASGSRAGSGGAGGSITNGAAGTNGGGTNCPDAGTGGGGGGGAHGGIGGGSGLCQKGLDTPGSGGGGGGGSSLIAAGLVGSIVGGASHGDGLVILAAVIPGVPTAPTPVQAIGSPLTGTVSFLPPTDDGGSSITSYTVTSIPEGHTATGTSSPITVTGLTTQTPYTFTIHATNAVGNSAESLPTNQVTTIFAPDPPRVVSTTAGDSSATIAFNPPVSDGGRPIISYTAIARQGSALSGPGTSLTSATSPITIGGLTNGTTYTITVLATNSVGNSGEALGAMVVPLALPSAPTDVSATVVAGGISVSFSPPLSTGGAPIDSYTVSSTDGSLKATGSSSPLLMTGMTNGLTYVFTVHATTRAGNGPESAPTTPILWTSNTALSPPLNVSAAPGNQQATVSFHAPLDNGGSPVTSYTVTSNPGGITASGAASPITVTGLTNGVSYTFTVVAFNANGSSQPSAPSNAVTPTPPTVPGTPPAPVASASNQGALVSVSPPLSDGGSPITSYTVTSTPGGITATGTASPITITGLTNGVSYTFTVTATNGIGSGQASPPSNAITPSGALPPANDNFANAQVIVGDSGSVTGTNVNATTEAGEPGPAGASVWYVWNVTHGGVVQIDTCGSSFSPSVIAYTGSALNALTPLASSTVGVFCGGTTISGIQVALPPNGGTIYIAVDGGVPTNTVTGSIQLNWGAGG